MIATIAILAGLYVLGIVTLALFLRGARDQDEAPDDESLGRWRD